ncbi:esterase [Modestobacter sp. I12A-02628]|uniref:Esterase n=1 Tax=Goekera deserti TaxID=2497753 RepID=A0A7K3WDF0_9ACTN|nr:alpha/beta hydrolase-fold protein [Goekera deserti]MPQ96752.1 esterase [Goekera deserti]NDI46934.1 esterase [Goekera deserti]NEL54502.1 esterase [Goekera deserti]
MATVSADGVTGVGELSLVRGVLPAVLLAGMVTGLLVLLAGHRDRRWWLRRVPVALLVAALLLAGAQVWLVVDEPFPDALPWTVPLWVGLGLLAVSLAVVGWPGQRWWRRGVAVLAVGVVVLGSANQVNRVYGSFSTVASALQLAPSSELSVDEVVDRTGAADAPTGSPGAPLEQVWQPPADMPAQGGVSEVTIPGTTSGFTARDAWVYVPPAYLTADPPALPVLVLLGGQPGGPRDWIDGGALVQRMDDFAAAHHGLAPVVVMPDDLGAETANPLCLDSRLGKADTYLAVDVPAWITSHLHVDDDRAHWGVGGLSYGGTCALQLGVGHPDVYPSIVDVSGQEGPTLGDRDRTVQAAFGGDSAAFDAATPLVRLATRPLPGSAAFVTVGSDDTDYRPQAMVVRDALSKAGVAVTYQELPGGHSWAVWGPSLTAALPWFATRAELTA